MYLFSDGFQDQFGGNPKEKYLRHRFYDLLHQVHILPMNQQKQALETSLQEWMALYPNNEQTDDILVMGIKLES